VITAKMANKKFCFLTDHHCVICTQLGQLILRKIIQTAVIRRHILKLKCTLFDFKPLVPACWGNLQRSTRSHSWI